MTARQRQSARRRRIQKRKRNRLRNISVVLLFFLGVVLAIILAIPATEFTGKIRTFLLGNLGYLSILIPLFLFQTGAWLLDLRMKKTGFRILSGIAVIGYFFTAVIDVVISRLSGGFHNIPGGNIAGGLGDILIPLTGAPIAFLILFTAFVASLVAFTGWDIGRDFQSLADNFLRLLGGMRQKRKTGKSTRSAGESGSTTTNAWSKEQIEEDVTELPFMKEEIPGEPSRDKKPVPVSGKPRTSIGTDQQDLTGFVIPPISCLELPDERLRKRTSPQMMKEQVDLLVEKLDDFGIECRIENSYPGPVITRFEVTPGPGIKVNRFVSLSDDLALALKARRIRILAPIPGKGAVGIEVPNPFPETVYLREIMDEHAFHYSISSSYQDPG
jgi:S-DNA-T family DNA segregation ATPase FtsK/SpoIIIE